MPLNVIGVYYIEIMHTLSHHTPNKRGQKASSRGFTIIELLVVIVVIAILAAVTVVAYNGVQARAKNAAIVSSINGSLKLLNMYHTENGSWPQEPAPGKQGLEYCLGRGYSTTTDNGTSGYDSISIISPRQWCTDYGGSGRAESNWTANTLAQYGTLPQATALSGSGLYAPIYGVSYPGFVLSWANIPDITYPVVNGVTQNGSSHYITYALKGDVPSCGITNAQRLMPGTYNDNTVCIIMLEFFGA